ncbi:glycoside hydrolase family 17 protein [Xylaria intraflava]|nr:glycoside hydrolase family 17 protein [Xylaria intraflava]
MKFFAITLAIFALLHLSFGQPRHGHGVSYRHRANRGLIQNEGTITISDASYPEPTAFPEVVVYVDQYGNTITTVTETVVYIPKETPPPQPPSSPSTTSSDSLQSSVSVFAPPAVATTPIASTPYSTYPTPTVEPTPEPSSQIPEATATPIPFPFPPTQPNPSSSGGGLHGVTYSPYKGDGNCKTADDVDRDFALFAKDYGVVRIYGVDCNQVFTVSQAAKKYGNKLFLGIFNINTIDSAVATMATSLYNDWSIVDTVSVGNELVNSGMAVSASLAALAEARSALRAAGYQGPVVAVDTFNAVLNNPEICEQSDYCAFNIHAFFDPNTAAPEAGSFVNSIMTNIRAKLSDPNKRLVATESGWPWQGLANGVAVPSLENQAAALSSIKDVFSSNPADVFLFTAFNDLWKKPEASTFMAEQYWGMGGLYSPCDHQ